MKKFRAGIIGASGYAGAELLRLLLRHPNIEVAALSSVSYEGQTIDEVYPAYSGVCALPLVSADEAATDYDLVYCSLPHGHAEPLARKCVDAGGLFVDLGADFRLSNESDYGEWYGLSYNDKALHVMAVYSIPELDGEKLPGARIIGNPGCYPTAAVLGMAPALKAGLIKPDSIIIDSKSGVTGAGRSLSLGSHFTECNEAFAPYKIASHRHTPEIEQSLSSVAGRPVTITFVPHLLPVNRGIVSTCYASFAHKASLDEVVALYNDFYGGKAFVRVMKKGQTANLKYVTYSNYCNISLHTDDRTGRLIIVSAIDNMIKGAAGQAIQNTNIALGLEETAGLGAIPPSF